MNKNILYTALWLWVLLLPIQGFAQKVQESLRTDSLSTQSKILSSAPFTAYAPGYWGGPTTWGLHRGLNVQVGLSAFTTWGKGNLNGTGFTQRLSAWYAEPLTKHITVAAGGYIENVNWRGSSYRNGGFSAVAAYRFNDRWSAYVYGQKSVMTGFRMPYTLYDISQIGDRIGAAVRYNFNPSLSVEVSVEKRWLPAGVPYYGFYDDSPRFMLP